MDINIVEGFERVKNDFIFLQKQFALSIAERDKTIHLLREENLDLRKKLEFYNKQIDFLLADQSSPKKKVIQIGKCLINIDWSKTGKSSAAKWGLKKTDKDVPEDISPTNIRTILRLSGKRKGKPSFSILSTGSTSSNSSIVPIAPTVLSSTSTITPAASSTDPNSASVAGVSRVPTISGSSTSTASEAEPAFKYRCPTERRRAFMPNLVSLAQGDGALTAAASVVDLVVSTVPTPGVQANRTVGNTTMVHDNTVTTVLPNTNTGASSNAAVFSAAPAGGGYSSSSRSGASSSSNNSSGGSSALFHCLMTHTQAPESAHNNVSTLSQQQPQQCSTAGTAGIQHMYYAHPHQQQQHLYQQQQQYQHQQYTWSAAPAPACGTVPMPMQPFTQHAQFSGVRQPRPAPHPYSAASGLQHQQQQQYQNSAGTLLQQPLTRMIDAHMAVPGTEQARVAQHSSNPHTGAAAGVQQATVQSAQQSQQQQQQSQQRLQQQLQQQQQSQQQQQQSQQRLQQQQLSQQRQQQQSVRGGASSSSTDSVQSTAVAVGIAGMAASAPNPVAVPEISADVLESLWASISDELPLLDQLRSASSSSSGVSSTAAVPVSTALLSAHSHVSAQPLNYSEALQVMTTATTADTATGTTIGRMHAATTRDSDYLAMLRVMKDNWQSREGVLLSDTAAASATATANSDPSNTFLLPFIVPTNTTTTNTNNNSSSSSSNSNTTDMLPVQPWHQAKDSSLRAKVVENVIKKLQQDQGAPPTTEAALHIQRAVMKFEQVAYYSSKAKMDYVAAIAKAVKLSNIG